MRKSQSPKVLTGAGDDCAKMLKRIYIDNYKCLRHFDLKLEAVSLLLGPNGVGKSSVLSVIRAIVTLLRDGKKITNISDFALSTMTEKRWQDLGDGLVQRFEIEVELDGDTFIYRLDIRHVIVSDDGFEKISSHIAHEGVRLQSGDELFSFKEGKVRLYTDSHDKSVAYSLDWAQSALATIAPDEINARLLRFRDFMCKLIVCSIVPDNLEAIAHKPEEVLSPDAANFVGWYWSHVREKSEEFKNYLDMMKDIIDGLSDIHLVDIKSDKRLLLMTFSGEDGPYFLESDDISDGQRVLMILYALLHLTPRPFCVLLDEPENYVSLREIQPWLSELQMTCDDNDSQVILCSHHPELIDYLGGERGILMKREENRQTTATPIATMDFDDDGLKLSESIARGWI